MASLIRSIGAATVAAAIFVGCSDGDSGTGPSGSGTCRLFGTAYTTTSTGAGVTSTINGTCSFDRSTKQTTCTNRYADNLGASNTATVVTTYQSVEDLVDEVRVVPPLTLFTTLSSTVTGTTPSVGTRNNTFDAQRRIVGETGTTNSSSYSRTYTAWDSAGRPTAATNLSGGVAATQTYTYNDTTRALTQSVTILGATQTCTTTFDANGNPTGTVCPTAAATTTTVNTTTSTQSICK